MDEKIEAILIKYREALMNDEEFFVLKQIREELKVVLQMAYPSMVKDLPPENT
jgi:hypothetical protein